VTWARSPSAPHGTTSPRSPGVTTELTYTLRQLTSDTIVFVGKNKGATSTDTIVLNALPAAP
jgi:hypothetical protein